MATFDGQVGKDCKLYYNTGTYATPTWTLIDRASDVAADLGKSEAEATSRLSTYRLFGPGPKEWTLNFTYLHKVGNGDTVFNALEASYTTDTIVDVVALDGLAATSGSVGPRAHFIAFQMNLDQTYGETMTFDFSLRPTLADDSGTLRLPTWHEIP